MIKNILFIIVGFMFSRELEIEFLSEDPWLTGHPWASGIAFDNGVTYGLGVYGTSSIGADNAIDVEIYFSEHHFSHAASAFYPSPFNDAIISLS